MLNVRLTENIVYSVQIQTVVILKVNTVCECDCEDSVYPTHFPVNTGPGSSAMDLITALMPQFSCLNPHFSPAMPSDCVRLM